MAQRWAAVAVIVLCLRVDAWKCLPSSSLARPATNTPYGRARLIMPMPPPARATRRSRLVTRAEGTGGTDDADRDDSAPANSATDEAPQFIGGLVREEEPPSTSIMQAAAQAKVSGIVLVASIVGSASLPDTAKPALLAIAALSGVWTVWKIQPVLKAVQAQVQAESTTLASDESGFDPFDPSTAQFIGTVSASPAAPPHQQPSRLPHQPRHTPLRLYYSCTVYTSPPRPSTSRRPGATSGASACTCAGCGGSSFCIWPFWIFSIGLLATCACSL